MKISILAISLSIIGLNLKAQESVNVLCIDFKKNNAEFSQGKDFRQSFESVLSNLKNPPRLIEREKLGEILIKIQNEENLQKDFNNSYTNKLNAAQIDYLIYGNFHFEPLDDKITFRSECIKISKDNITSKLVFPSLQLTKKELSDFVAFEAKIREMLTQYSFVEGLGVVETKQIEEINRKLDEKDQKIKKLQDEVAMLSSGNVHKILFNGSYLEKKDASTLVRAGTKENTIFKQLILFENEKNNAAIIELCDSYLSTNKGSNWWTPAFSKGVASINLGKQEEGFKLFDEIIENVPGDEDYIVRIASIYKQLGNSTRLNLLFSKIPSTMKKIVEARLGKIN